MLTGPSDHAWGGMVDRLRAMWRHGLRPGSPAAYGFGVFCVAISGAVGGALGTSGPDVSPFDTFYPASLMATFLGGSAAGVLAAVLCAILAWWLFVPPAFAFLPLAWHDVVNFFVFVCV